MARGIQFDDLLQELSRPSAAPVAGGKRFIIPKRAGAFVKPPLQINAGDSTQNPLAVEVILVAASAAVGKTTMARELSALSGAPLLNLATVPVAEQALLGMLSGDLTSGPNSVAEFHQGKLPIIVDALDEGRSFSGLRSFEAFLESTGELLQRDRHVTNRPKVVFFGRHESIDLASMALEMRGAGITKQVVEVGFFDEAAATELINVYAKLAAPAGAPYHEHPKPVADLIGAYFDAIEGALEIPKGELWKHDTGRAFAGYAPVLAALGFMIADMDKFVDVTNKLRSSGTTEAWDVIDLVVDTILYREGHKFRTRLKTKLKKAIPDEAYDRAEQLAHLTRYAHKQPVVDTGRVKLGGSDQLQYLEMVEQEVPEHPFVRHGALENPVLAAVVLASAVVHDRLHEPGTKLLETQSRQPFLWRSVREYTRNDVSVLLDGTYIGCLLNSFWTDPLNRKTRVLVRSGEEQSAKLHLLDDGRELALEFTLPLRLYGQAHNLDVDIDGAVHLCGYAAHGSESTFVFSGNDTVACVELVVETEALSFEGSVWIEAQNVQTPQRIELRHRNGFQVGWGGALVGRYPWNRMSQTLKKPKQPADGDPLAWLVGECKRRWRAGTVLTLYSDLLPVEDDPHTRWLERADPELFVKLIRTMAKTGLASIESRSAGGSNPKISVHFNAKWEDIESAIQEPGAAPPALRALIETLRG